MFASVWLQDINTDMVCIIESPFYLGAKSCVNTSTNGRSLKVTSSGIIT